MTSQNGGQDGAMAPRWPPWLQDGRHDSKMAAKTSGDPVTRSGVCHALDHGRNGLGPECGLCRDVLVPMGSLAPLSIC